MKQLNAFLKQTKKNPPKMEENGARMLLCHRKILKNRTRTLVTGRRVLNNCCQAIIAVYLEFLFVLLEIP